LARADGGSPGPGSRAPRGACPTSGDPSCLPGKLGSWCRSRGSGGTGLHGATLEESGLDDREEIEAERVILQAGAARLDPCGNQERPEIALIIVHFVIVHLDGRAGPEPERRVFEENLAPPGGHVDKQQTVGPQQAVAVLQGPAWPPEVFEDRYEQD